MRLIKDLDLRFIFLEFRFSMWIKDQKLPEVLKVYCKNVLHFLGSRELCGFRGNYWIPVEWMDQENGNEEQHQVEDN